MKIYLLEPKSNMELYNYLNARYNLTNNILDSNVIIIHKVCNIKLGLDIVDLALKYGIEIICIKSCFAKEHYVTNYLIKNGANYV